MMRIDIKQQRWDHTNSLLTTDISLKEKKHLTRQNVYFTINYKLKRTKHLP